MAVIRVQKSKDYTVMANYHFKDRTLSLKAKGLMSLMLSLPDDWDYTVAGLVTLCRDGRDSIRSALKELEEAGYLKRERNRNGKGQVAEAIYTLSEKPVSENPTQANPVQAKPPQLNTKVSSTKKLSTKTKDDEDEEAGLGECFRMFENNIHPLTGMIERDKIIELYGKYHAGWFKEAVKVAALRHGRSVSYIEAILDGWERDGFKAKKGAAHGLQGSARKNKRHRTAAEEAAKWANETSGWD